MVLETVTDDIQCYVLDLETKQEIQSKLELELLKRGYDDLDIDELITNAIDDCELKDLKDVINIYTLETQKVIKLNEGAFNNGK